MLFSHRFLGIRETYGHRFSQVSQEAGNSVGIFPTRECCCVGVNLVGKNFSHSGRDAAIVAIKILDKIQDLQRKLVLRI